VLLGHFNGVDGPQLTFGDDLEEHIRIADEGARTARVVVDDYISRTGMEAPLAEPDPADTIMPPLPSPPIRAINPIDVGLTSVIWCTGFGADFSWVRLPVLDERGTPAHQLGVSKACPGIFFIGLPWLSTRKSALVVGVADDAQRIAGLIVARR
jgi:putative flavoprotein involved in K+ transport